MDPVIDKELAWSNLKASFERADLPAFKSISGDAQIFANLQQVETWGRQTKRELSDLTKTHRADWVAKEVDKVWLERQRMTPELKPPLQSRSLSSVAHERVDRRIEQGYAAIDLHMRTEQTRLVQQPEHDIGEPARDPVRTLEQTGRDIIDQVVADVSKTYAQYEHNRESFIQNAHKDGVPNPQGAYEQARLDAVDNIRTNAHARMQSQFREHSVSRVPVESQAIPTQSE